MTGLAVLLIHLLTLQGINGLFHDERNRYDHDESPNQRDSPPVPVDCMLVQAHALNIDGEPEADENQGWKCVVGTHSVFSLEGLPPDFIQSNNLDARDSAISYLSISAANIYKSDPTKPLFGRSIVPKTGGSKIIITADATVSLIRQDRRALQQTADTRTLQTVVPADEPTGDHTLLVVRVIDKTGDAPSKSAYELSDGIFSDAINLRSQYLACSGKKIDFVPATGTNVVGGVVDLTIPHIVSGRTKEDVESWASDAFQAAFGEYAQWSHVMFVLPSSVVFGKAAAVGYVGWGLTIFESQYADTLLVLMHELGTSCQESFDGHSSYCGWCVFMFADKSSCCDAGHNMRMSHSGLFGGSNYGDETCMMGAHCKRCALGVLLAVAVI